MDKNKYLSRKFLLAILSAIGGVAISLTQLGGKVGIVCAIISAVLPPITYIVAEGVVDAKAVDKTAEAVKEIWTIVKDKDGYFAYSEDENNENEK